MELEYESMTVDEINSEILECARYGEDEELRKYITHGGDVNACDHNGNSALHKAAANGELQCIKVLKEFNANHIQNHEGNFPLHWAAQNGKTDVVKFLLENFSDIDVLIQNKFGRSVLTEAFQSKTVETIELILSHPSATEEKLMPSTCSHDAQPSVSNNSGGNMDTDDDDDEGSEGAVFHSMSFPSSTTQSSTSADNENAKYNRDKILKIRELPITRADNPFGTDVAPEDDTTGLGIWPASILAARWAVHNKDKLIGRTVVELGAGCGLPGLAVAMYCSASEVHITDIHKPTLRNAVYNVHLNTTTALTDGVSMISEGVSNVSLNSDEEFETFRILDNSSSSSNSSSCADNSGSSSAGNSLSSAGKTKVSVKYVDWGRVDSYPVGRSSADVVIGSDLVYDEAVLGVLVPAIHCMLKIGGCFLYVSPTEGRSGMDGLEAALAAAGIECTHKQLATSEFHANPLAARSLIGEEAFLASASSAYDSNAMATEAVEPTGERTAGCVGVGASEDKDGSSSSSNDDDAELIDDYILHFYDLSIHKPHYLYIFTKVR